MDFILFGLLAGIVCGIAPLIIAIKKGRDSFGVWSMVACAIAGTILGMLLAVPVAGIACALLIADNPK